jgi:hypothetical protein
MEIPADRVPVFVMATWNVAELIAELICPTVTVLGLIVAV